LKMNAYLSSIFHLLLSRPCQMREEKNISCSPEWKQEIDAKYCTRLLLQPELSPSYHRVR
jgi:hypothetical protein